MKNLKIELKWAGIFACMTLVWMMLERIVGLHDEHISMHPIYTNLIAMPAIAIYVLALLDKRKNFYDGIMTYKQGFMSGLYMSVIIMVLSPITQIITSTIITPHYFENVINHAVETEMMTQEVAEKYFNLKSYIIQSVFGAIVMGIITSAIVAIFTIRKTKK